MLFDALTAAGAAKEFQDLAGGRIQAVIQPDALSLGIELYVGDRWYVTWTADPGSEGLVVSPERIRRGADADTPLTLAARSRLTGARLAGVDWPRFERILVFRFETHETRGPREFRLILEAMGHLSNVILVGGDGLVMAAAKRVTGRMTRARIVAPGQPYEAPPPQTKADPDAVTSDEVAGWLADAGRPDRALVQHVRGLSPTAAREAIHRAGGDGDRAPDAERVRAALTGLFADVEAGQAQPSLARSDTEIEAYAPYWLSHLAEPTEGEPGLTVVATESTLAAIAAYVRDELGRDPYRQARDAVGELIEAARDRLQRKVAALAREAPDEGGAEADRLKGELILAFQGRVQPGDTELAASFDPEAEPTTIRLDPALTPAENAERYFKRYKRRRRAAEALPRRRAAAEADLAHLDELAYDLEAAEDRAEIDAVHDALVAAGFLKIDRPRRTTGRPKGPMRFTSAEGFTVWVGRNSRQNETVTFDKGARGDVWLHAHGVPGAHVVVKAAGRDVPDATVRAAASVAAHYSRARDDAQAAVIVADVRHVRRVGGGRTGLVRVKSADSVTVAPLPPAQAFDAPPR